MLLRLVILDRDDTLIQLPAGRRYVAGEDAFELMPGAAEFVAALNRVGIFVVVATNQQGAALAEYPEITAAAVERLHDRIQEALTRCVAGRGVEFARDADRRPHPHPGPLPRWGVNAVVNADCGGEGGILSRPGDSTVTPDATRIDRFFVCPHAAAANCGCRKPRPGLVIQALAEFGVSPAEAAIIGDRETDMQAGAAAGIAGRYWLNGPGATSRGISQRASKAMAVESFGECLTLMRDTLMIEGASRA